MICYECDVSFSALGAVGGQPSNAVGYSLVRVGRSFRLRKAATWCMISAHRFRILGGTTTVRLVLAVQPRLSMPMFSPPQPIRGLCTGFHASCCFTGGRAYIPYNQRYARGEGTASRNETYSRRPVALMLCRKHNKGCVRTQAYGDNQNLHRRSRGIRGVSGRTRTHEF